MRKRLCIAGRDHEPGGDKDRAAGHLRAPGESRGFPHRGCYNGWGLGDRGIAIMKRAVLCGWLMALLLAGCSWLPSAGPSGREVARQANPGNRIAFDVVKVDDAVVKVLHAHRAPPFHERFKKYIPP